MKKRKLLTWLNKKKRVLLFAKFLLIFLVLGVMQVSAGEDSHLTKLTIKLKNASILEVLAAIQSQSDFEFFYSDEQMDTIKKIDIDVVDATIEEVLELCFKGSKLTYEIVDKVIIIKPVGQKNAPSKKTKLEPIEVKGKITDEDGIPLPGATILEEGTLNGTTSDENGNFKLELSTEAPVLIVSYIGFEKQKIVVGNETELVIVLKQSENSLDEVVITGYQTLPKERVTGSFAKPNLDVVQDRTSSMNVLNRLDGLIPGLTTNNAPNAEGLLIRGLSSINANRSPLYVVDGIQMSDISSINPQDIADISVLKDATAASVWGSRAANGVIVITTKKGKATDNKIKVTYDAFVNFQGKPDLNYLPGLNSEQFIQTVKELFDPVAVPYSDAFNYVNTGSHGVPPHEVILYDQFLGNITEAQANAKLDSLASINNLQEISDLWYRNASLMNHTLTLSGGSNSYTFYGSLSYTNTQSDQPGEKDEDYKINFRQDLNLKKNIRLYLITDLTRTVTEAKRTFGIGNRFYPYQRFQDAEGNNLSMPYMRYFSEPDRKQFEQRSRIDLDWNPLDEFNYGYTKGNAFLARITGGITVDVLPGLKFEGVYGYVRNNSEITKYDDEKSYLVRVEVAQFTVAETPEDTPIHYLPETGGRYSIQNQFSRNWTIRNQMTFEKTFMEKHELTVLFGQEAQEQLTKLNGSTVRGYNEALQTFSPVDYEMLSKGISGAVVPQVGGRSSLRPDYFNQSEPLVRFSSYYANVAYTFDKKYSFNGSWRIDESNLFGLEKSAQNKPVWGLGFKWDVSDESFMGNQSWIDHLALRTTFGVTGNSPIPGTASSYDIIQANASSRYKNGLTSVITSPANSKLTWESTKSLNIGIDFALFNNRLSGTIDFYSKKTTDLIGYYPTNAFTGYSSTIGNLGDMENKGFELSLSSLNIQKKDFSWTSLFVLSYNKNKITKLNSETPITGDWEKLNTAFLEGYEAFAVFAYKYVGLDEMGDPQIMLANGDITKTPNAATAEDVVFMGTRQPKWSGGFSNTFRYKQFSLSANIVYNLGYVMRKPAENNFTGEFAHHTGSTGTGGNVSVEIFNRWKKPGDEDITTIPAYITNRTENSRRDINYYNMGDINVFSASFIKLRDITLSYSLPKSLLSRINIDEIILRAQVSNIMLWKANKHGLDPEFTGSDRYDNSIITIPVNQNTLTLGLRVAF